MWKKDSGKRSIVKNAWAEAQRLAELAAQGLTDLAKEYPRSAENDTAARNSIARTSPASVSMSISVATLTDFPAQIEWHKFSEVKLGE